MTRALGFLAYGFDAPLQAVATPQSGAEGAVATTIDLTLLTLGPLVGGFVGFAVSVVLALVGNKVFANAATASAILKRVRRPSYFTFLMWGAWVGLGVALLHPRVAEWSSVSATVLLARLLLVLALTCLTWMVYSAAWVFEDAARIRQESDSGCSRRFATRAQVLRRVLQSVVAVVGFLAVIGTFEGARQAMTTVLASAGVLSVIAGLAAQQTLGNVFAGLQLAFTDAIRVGDVVVAGEKKETGSVEEITLSYVVVRVWDERRLIVPCRYFTTTPFENWTRRASALLGAVELKLDWSAPMALIRAKVESLLASTDLWDGRTWGVQVTDSSEYTVTVRVVVSAKNSGTLSDLRAYLREHLISWIVTEEPWARPVQRIEPRQAVTVEHDADRERIVRLASELAGPSSIDEAGEGARLAAVSSDQPVDAAQAARIMAARRKATRARRRAVADRHHETPEGEAKLDETQVISKSTLRKIIEAASSSGAQSTQPVPAVVVGRGERFFSGSADAEERAAAFEGPGEDAYAEREAEARRIRERRERRKRQAQEAAAAEAAQADAQAHSEAADAIENSERVEVAESHADSVEATKVLDRVDDEGPTGASSPEAAPPDDSRDGQLSESQTPEDATDASVAHDAAPAVSAQPHVPADSSLPGCRAENNESAGESVQPEQPENVSQAAQAAQAAEDAERGIADEENDDDTERETAVKQSGDAPASDAENPAPAGETMLSFDPTLAPPPAPTAEEMAASQAPTGDDEEEDDEPTIHPDWYAVAEEARLDDEAQPKPVAQPAARVSIMDFFPSVAPTGAEADVLRAVTGQIPIVSAIVRGDDEQQSPAESDEAAASEAAEAPAAESERRSDTASQAEASPDEAEGSEEKRGVQPEDDPAGKPVDAPADEADEGPADAQPAQTDTAVTPAVAKAAAKKQSAKKTTAAKKSAKKATGAKKTLKDAEPSTDGEKEGASQKESKTGAKKATKKTTKKAATKKTAAKETTRKKTTASKKSSAKPPAGE